MGRLDPMKIELISTILSVALVLLVLSIPKSTRHMLWQSVLYPFRKDESDDSMTRGVDNSDTSQRNVQ